MEVGDVVFNGWRGFRRYGVITSTEILESWKYCVVNWVNDEVYEGSVDWVNKLRNTTNYGREKYRVDELVKIDAKHELATLKNTQKLAKKTIKLKKKRKGTK
jgi:hypothetical protein